jgi:anhydro-N-acetylmuramic acid kinase
MRVVGALSGTSVDGIDVCVVDIGKVQERKEEKNGVKELPSFEGKEVFLTPIVFETIPWKPKLRSKILQLCANEGSKLVQTLCVANFEVGEAFANAILQVLAKHKIPLEQIDLIASHGQTVWHEVVEENKALKVKGTLQIGEPAVIAARTGITTGKQRRKNTTTTTTRKENKLTPL